jgi:CHASE2 domain-containing sensor protein
MSTQRFFLKVSQIEQTCLFQLDAGQGRSLQQSISFPTSLTNLYENWRSLYRKFYGNLRGRVEFSGTGTLPPQDWRVQLAQAEVLLLNEFYFWLSNAALLPIRSCLAEAAQLAGGQTIDLFLSCDPIDLERLPWEAWDIGAEFAATQVIRVTRSPVNIRYSANSPQRQGRTRILAILGDDTGLSFQHEIDILKGLKTNQVADVTFVGWQAQLPKVDLKQEITQALGDRQGWDILFFAGHSNETVLSQGEIYIAPGQSMLLKELQPYLKQAQQHGLQVAIFNSCSGLSIAQGLIDLGLSQVVVMREPVHNQVAQEFFLQLVKRLADYDDINTAVRSACQYLRLERPLTFPSSYLVPSLYGHPDAKPFRARAVGIKARLRQWVPTAIEVVGLVGLIGLSTSLNVQQRLIHERQWGQAIYRHITGQKSSQKPPVLLVQIETDSIKNNKIEPLRPMDKGYLGRLLTQAQKLRAPIVGLDYLLDRPQKQADPLFARSVQALVGQGSKLTVVVTRGENDKWLRPPISLVDDRNVSYGNMALIREAHQPSIYASLRYDGQPHFPFAYQLAQDIALQRGVVIKSPVQPSAIAEFSYGLGQMWLHPVIDYSMPPDTVYRTMPAWRFLELSSQAKEMQDLSNQVLLIVPGLYDEAGVKTEGEDHYLMPPARRYWHNDGDKMTGGEIHAYLIKHWLDRSLIYPIPDLWAVLATALVTKGILLYQSKLVYSKRGYTGLGVCFAIGILLSFHFYVVFQILLPILLPIVTVGFYLLSPVLRKWWHEKSN